MPKYKLVKRSHNEDTRYQIHIDAAIDDVNQAINCITYTLKEIPNINGELISKLQNVTDELDDLKNEIIYKPEKIEEIVECKEITELMVTRLNTQLKDSNNPIRFEFVNNDPNIDGTYAVCKVYNESFATPHIVTMSNSFISFLKSYFKKNYNMKIDTDNNHNTIYSVEV